MNNERAKILIVDDDAMNRVVLSDLLSDEYDIIEAKDGDDQGDSGRDDFSRNLKPSGGKSVRAWRY